MYILTCNLIWCNFFPRNLSNMWSTQFHESIKFILSSVLLSFQKQAFNSSHGMTHWGLFICLFFPWNLLTSFAISLRTVSYSNPFCSFNWIFPIKKRKKKSINSLLLSFFSIKLNWKRKNWQIGGFTLNLNFVPCPS